MDFVDGVVHLLVPFVVVFIVGLLQRYLCVRHVFNHGMNANTNRTGINVIIIIDIRCVCHFSIVFSILWFWRRLMLWLLLLWLWLSYKIDVYGICE